MIQFEDTIAKKAVKIFCLGSSFSDSTIKYHFILAAKTIHPWKGTFW